MSVSARRWLSLLQADAKNVTRNPVLLFSIAMSAIPAVLFYFWSGRWDVLAWEAFELAEFSRYIAPLILVLPGLLLGWVTGFLLLEDRDDGTLLAVDVTPLGKGGLLLYRASITMALTFVLTLAACALVVPSLELWLQLNISVAVALEAACAAFVLPSLARNKVEGLAVTKLTNLSVVFVGFAAIASPWRYCAGVVPTYWVGEVLLLSDTRYLGTSTAVAVSLMVHFLVATGLYRLLVRRVG